MSTGASSRRETSPFQPPTSFHSPKSLSSDKKTPRTSRRRRSRRVGRAKGRRGTSVARIALVRRRPLLRGARVGAAPDLSPRDHDRARRHGRAPGLDILRGIVHVHDVNADVVVRDGGVIAIESDEDAVSLPGYFPYTVQKIAPYTHGLVDKVLVPLHASHPIARVSIARAPERSPCGRHRRCERSHEGARSCFVIAFADGR